MDAVVCRAIAPLYASPEIGELADEVLFGMTVRISGRQNGFCRVETGYRYTGWVPEECLLECDADRWETAALFQVSCGWADVLDAPRVQGRRLADLPRGGRLCPDPARKEENAWTPVLLPDGAAGWVPARCLERRPGDWHAQDPSALRRALCDAARSYLGAQYRWGGKTVQGVDCSGLVSMAYLLNGITIYRDAKLKEGFALHPIPLEEIRPADLLFFPGHVAMYLGKGLFIHSTAHNGSQGCCIASLSPSDARFRADLRDSITAAASIF